MKPQQSPECSSWPHIGTKSGGGIRSATSKAEVLKSLQKCLCCVRTLSLPGPPENVEDWRSEEPQLRRESSQCVSIWTVKQTTGLGVWKRMIERFGEVGERELVLVVSVRCGNERDMTVLTHCEHLYMLHQWVFIGKFISEQPKLVLNSEKHTNCQTAKNAKYSNFSSSNCYGSNLLTRTNATGFPVTLNYKTASQFEDRLDSRARRFLRMLVSSLGKWSMFLSLFTCSSCIILHSPVA